MFSQVSSRGGAGYVHGVSILGVGMPGVGISRVGLGMSRGWVPTPRHEISSRTHRPTPGDETWDTMEYGWQAGGKHPTGMLSCSKCKW